MAALSAEYPNAIRVKTGQRTAAAQRTEGHAPVSAFRQDVPHQRLLCNQHREAGQRLMQAVSGIDQCAEAR